MEEQESTEAKKGTEHRGGKKVQSTEGTDATQKMKVPRPKKIQGRQRGKKRKEGRAEKREKDRLAKTSSDVRSLTVLKFSSQRNAGASP